MWNSRQFQQPRNAAPTRPAVQPRPMARPQPVNGGMFTLPTARPPRLGSFGGNSSPGGPGDASGVGGEGFGPGAPAAGNTTQEAIANALHGAKPYSDNGQSWIQNQMPGWRDVVGMAAGQVPGGGSAWSMAQLMANQNPKARDIAETGFNLMAGPLGGATKIADAYAGTRYAREHPVASYGFGGNADMGAANAADRAYGQGGNAGFMAQIYDLENGVNNQGGRGTGPGGIGYSGVGNDMADTLGNQVNQGIADPSFLDQAGGYLNAVNAQNGPSQQGGGYAGQAQDIRDTISQQQFTGTYDPAVMASLGVANGASGAQYTNGLDTGGDAGSGGGDSAPMSDAYSGGGGWADGPFNKGGRVPKRQAGEPNPPGPDDQYITAKTGEMVLTAEQAQKLRPQIAAMLRRGK